MTKESPRLREFEALVRVAVEPVVRRAGFDWNPSGLGHHQDTGEATALFEAMPGEFGRRFPSLNPSYGDEPLCIDLWIRYHLDQRMIRADLEGTDVARWLRDYGHPELAESLQAPSDIEVATRTLSSCLGAMLYAAEEGSGI